jgi:DNA polymerase phi
MIQTCLAAAVTMFPADSKSKKRRKSRTTAQPDSPIPIDMLVDVLIGFLEKSTSYLRAVANKTFLCIASAATETTIDLIIAVSNYYLFFDCTSSNFPSEQQLERRDPGDLVADEDDETESASGEGDNENVESSDDDDNESELDGDDEATLALRKKIEDALKSNGMGGAAGDTDDESEEELADDEQMMAIDEHLAEVFRSGSGNKQGKGMANLPRQ